VFCRLETTDSVEAQSFRSFPPNDAFEELNIAVNVGERKINFLALLAQRTLQC
jgi:hypothetical protein